MFAGWDLYGTALAHNLFAGWDLYSTAHARHLGTASVGAG